MRKPRKTLSMILAVFFGLFILSLSGCGLSVAELEAKGDLQGLIKKLEDKNPETRVNAAQALGRVGDRRAVDSLTKALRDKDSDVREAAAWALEKIEPKWHKTEAAKEQVPEFVKALRDWDTKEDALDILVNLLRWSPKTQADRVHMWVAQHESELLRKNWEMTKRVLLKDIDTGDKDIIAYALYSFIAIGKEEIIPVLIRKLYQEGTKEMAEAYLNCGHKKLYEAAENWAYQHGYRVSSGGGSAPVGWGCW